jgi:hypothetical protein
MRTLTASRRAVLASSVGLVLSLSLVACTQLAGGTPSALVGCMLYQFHGNLVAENGRPVFRTRQQDIPRDPVPLDLPDGWEIRATGGGQFEVRDGRGAVLATTGTRVIVLSDADHDTPALNADGELVVCAIDSYPMDLEVENAS